MGTSAAKRIKTEEIEPGKVMAISNLRFLTSIMLRIVPPKPFSRTKTSCTSEKLFQRGAKFGLERMVNLALGKVLHTAEITGVAIMLSPSQLGTRIRMWAEGDRSFTKVV